MCVWGGMCHLDKGPIRPPPGHAGSLPAAGKGGGMWVGGASALLLDRWGGPPLLQYFLHPHTVTPFLLTTTCKNYCQN